MTPRPYAPETRSVPLTWLDCEYINKKHMEYNPQIWPCDKLDFTTHYLGNHMSCYYRRLVGKCPKGFAP